MPESSETDKKELVKISDLARMSGVPTPTIKHYMREGLLPGPEKRTSRNMAYYDPRLADRVKVIKELQQTRYLPLKIIADLLEPAPSSEIRADLDEIQLQQLGALEPAIVEGSREARRRRAQDPSNRKRTRASVLKHLQVDADDLDELEGAGLVQPTAFKGGEPVYSGADLEMLEVISETREKGLGDLFPLPILEPYAAAIRTLVRVELELFRRRVLDGASLPAMGLDSIAREAMSLGERLVVAMRSKLVIPELHELVGQGPRGMSEGEAPQNGANGHGERGRDDRRSEKS